jgi:hypothetical protein
VEPSEQDSAQADWVARLCPQCGLCCNGVLFSDVKLVKGDDPLALVQEGLILKGSGRQQSFDQPCTCFVNGRCTIYLSRPQRCRRFDCHTLKQAQKGEISMQVALRRIRDALTDSSRVRELLRALGNEDEPLPLTRQYQAVMSQPMDLALGEEQADQRGELMLAVNDLMTRLHKHFLEPST